MIKISILMGVYNCKNKEFFEKSIDSIIGQTFKEWELIICDDGSTDDTLSVAKKIAQKDKRIKVIGYKTNRGLSYALNECSKHAVGKYYARQDDDDVSIPSRLEKLYLFMETHPEYAVVGSTAQVFDENEMLGEYTVPKCPEKEDFFWKSPFAHPTVMMRAEAFKQVQGYRCTKETRRCEDLDLFMRLYAAGYKGYNIQEQLVYYRINKNVQYRKMVYRIEEASVRYKGYKALKLYPKGLIYVAKPIVVGLIPQKIMKLIRLNQYK